MRFCLTENTPRPILPLSLPFASFQPATIYNPTQSSQAQFLEQPKKHPEIPDIEMDRPSRLKGQTEKDEPIDATFSREWIFKKINLLLPLSLLRPTEKNIFPSSSHDIPSIPPRRAGLILIQNLPRSPSLKGKNNRQTGERTRRPLSPFHNPVLYALRSCAQA